MKLETNDYIIEDGINGLIITHKYSDCNVAIRESLDDGDEFNYLIVDYSCNNVIDVNQKAYFVRVSHKKIKECKK